MFLLATAQKDSFAFILYRFAWLVLLVVGGLSIIAILGLMIAQTSVIDLISDLPNFLEPKSVGLLAGTLGVVLLVSLVVGWFQTAIISRIGEELILLTVYLTPFAVAGVSVFIYYQTQTIDYLGGLVVAVVFMAVVLWFRKKIRLSARLVEIGGEIAVSNPKMFLPEFSSLILTIIVTALWLSGVGLILIIASYLALPGIIGGIIVMIIYSFFYYFATSVIRATAEAINIAYTQQWYEKPSASPSLGQSKAKVKKLRGPVARYALLMGTVRYFRRNRSQSGFTPFSLFKYMRFTSWKDLVFGRVFGGSGGGVASTVARVVEYLGTFTLIIIVSKNLNSVTDAFKQSTKGVFHTFVTNIAGSMGINIVNSFRKLISFLLLVGSGLVYGYLVYAEAIGETDVAWLWAIIMGILFLVLGFIPLNAMFAPVVTSYQYVLYQTYIDSKGRGRISGRIDDKTKKLLKEIYDKK